MVKTRRKLTPEVLVPRLGEYLVQQGHIHEADLQRALDYQQTQARSHQRFPLGKALVALQLIDQQVLDNAITEQIIQLRNALEDANRFLEKRVRERTAELQEALRKLSEINQLKANFVANVSHELRTPLTHIKGYLELLSSESLGSLTAGQKEALSVSERSAERLEGLIDSLILFSVASRGEMSLKLVPVDLNKVVTEVISYSRLKADDKKVSLFVDMDANLPLIQADEEKISWAILQLLDNAIKFTPAGGRVILSIHPETDQMIGVSVSDNGIGIHPSRIREIFEPFHQLDGSSTRRYGGTGLGLTLVREIVNAHGSMIGVESDVGKGSTFHFPLLVMNTSTG